MNSALCDSIVEKHQTRNPYTIAKEENIHVWRSKDLSNNIHLVVNTMYDEKFIVVNENVVPATYEPAYVASGLAHHLLRPGHTFLKRTCEAKNDQEIEAIAFASRLLIEPSFTNINDDSEFLIAKKNGLPVFFVKHYKIEINKVTTLNL